VLQVVLAPPPVTFARSRRQSFSEFKSTSGHTPVIFLTKSVIFIYVTDSDDNVCSSGRRYEKIMLTDVAMDTCVRARACLFVEKLFWRMN
jgi:hypothetical protein